MPHLLTYIVKIYIESNSPTHRGDEQNEINIKNTDRPEKRSGQTCRVTLNFGDFTCTNEFFHSTRLEVGGISSVYTSRERATMTLEK